MEGGALAQCGKAAPRPQAWAWREGWSGVCDEQGNKEFLEIYWVRRENPEGKLTCLGMDVGPESIERMQEIHLLAGGLGTNRSSLCASGANITILPLLMAG